MRHMYYSSYRLWTTGPMLLVVVGAGCGGGTTPHPTSPSTVTAPSAATSVTVTPSAVGPAISPLVLGANMAVWYDITQSGVATAFQTAGMTATRWPGGSESDGYYWRSNTVCSGYASPNSTFDNFMSDVAKPAGLDVAITLDYGTDSTCANAGNPAEAAAWVKYANVTQGYGVHTWTVGNEVYGSWETDLHAIAHDPTTYAAAVTNGYYPQIKAIDTSAHVGVVVSGGGFNGWDQTVLAQATYDFVELHFYDQSPGAESDSLLIWQGPANLSAAVKVVESELATAGKSVPIYVGELGSVNTNPGKQTTSITQALYAGQVVAELLADGVWRATWWLGFGGCNTTSSGNFSSTLYGWQNFGGYMIFSDGIPSTSECAGTESVARGTLLPTARAYQVLSSFAVGGQHMIGASVGDSLPTIRAYAATAAGGQSVLLFNLDAAKTVTVPVTIAGRSGGSGLTLTTYGKAQYDSSQSNVWAAPVQTSAGAWTTAFLVQLPPWSMTVIHAP
jgi:hypothetical protein